MGGRGGAGRVGICLASVVICTLRFPKAHRGGPDQLSGRDVTLDLRVPSLSPMLGVKIT